MAVAQCLASSSPSTGPGRTGRDAGRRGTAAPAANPFQPALLSRAPAGPCRSIAPGGKGQRPLLHAEKLKPSPPPSPSSSSFPPPPPPSSASLPAPAPLPPPASLLFNAPSPPVSRKSSPSSSPSPSPQLSNALSLPSRPASPPDSERGRLGGRADSVFLTAPNVLPLSLYPPSLHATARLPPAVDAPPNVRLPRLSQQPSYPSFISAATRQSQPPVAAIAETLNPPPQARRPGTQQPPQPGYHFPSPFRSRTAASSAPRRPRRLPSARLWNPTNSTPRNFRPRKRRTSSPPAPSVPLQHPSLDKSAEASEDPAAGDYPLLTLSEQRQTKHSPTTRSSVQVEQNGCHDRRVSLPRSVRASYDGSRSRVSSPVQQDFGDKAASRWTFEDTTASDEPAKVVKGKARADAMAPDSEDPRQLYNMDLERGPDGLDPRPSNVSAGDGIGSALSSSNSSMMGEEVQPDAGEEWGPQHPCYPHLNPHVPVDSFEYATTRIIRIRRDWLLQGDLAPTFSNLYPEILDPAGVSEQEFRRIIEKLNGELVPTFDPYSFRNVVDSLLGLVTGWLWDDLGLTAIKTRLNALEKWIEKWNQEMEKTMASEEGAMTPKIIPLRRTAYMMVRRAWSRFLFVLLTLLPAAAGHTNTGP